MAIIHFPAGVLRHYGFDTLRDRVLSFKCGRNGMELKRRPVYTLNAHNLSHATVRAEATRLAKQQAEVTPKEALPKPKTNGKVECAKNFFVMVPALNYYKTYPSNMTDRAAIEHLIPLIRPQIDDKYGRDASVAVVVARPHQELKSYTTRVRVVVQIN